MNRRNFIASAVGAAAGLALKEAIPFNRVWFFPQKIRLANIAESELHYLYRTGQLGGFDSLAMPEVKSGVALMVQSEWPYGLRPYTLEDITRQIVRELQHSVLFEHELLTHPS